MTHPLGTEGDMPTVFMAVDLGDAGRCPLVALTSLGGRARLMLDAIFITRMHHAARLAGELAEMRDWYRDLNQVRLPEPRS